MYKYYYEWIYDDAGNPVDYIAVGQWVNGIVGWYIERFT